MARGGLRWFWVDGELPKQVRRRSQEGRGKAEAGQSSCVKAAILRTRQKWGQCGSASLQLPNWGTMLETGSKRDRDIHVINVSSTHQELTGPGPGFAARVNSRPVGAPLVEAGPLGWSMR